QQAFSQYQGALVFSLNEVEVRQFTVVVDGVFGTGFRGELPDHVCLCFDKINKLPVTRLALDVPSGINATIGEVAASAV
ncbi:NAD(P)H-hydrate epimerase, partial [Pseudoalteromonas sp. S981]|uniref:NAD(P)H-hydrate epimerase n=1 Tax=Pseudoalteromonas sp. S981 TaxID=579569 RepID=UPI0020172F1E